jgi:4-hydroxy-tetrahydrodipicolinate synthase
MVHQPVHPYQSTEGWVAYHREVADAIPEHGVVLYVRSPLIGAAGFRLLAEACPNVVGVKYAVPDPIALADLVRVLGDDRLVWSCGLAESWAPYFWLSGARGFTSGLATVAPEQSLALLHALRAGDHARAMAIWGRLRPFEEMRARRANALNVSVVKEALAQLGLCRPDERPPITPLTGAERAEVGTILKGLGVAAPAAA